MSNSGELQDLLVKFEELQKAAAAYKTEGGDVQEALTKFEAAANLPASAFGNLPESKQLASQYETFYKQVVGDMTKLAKSLPEGAASLAASAALYHRAEENIAQQIAQIGKT